jgi:hypothetical protein
MEDFGIFCGHLVFLRPFGLFSGLLVRFVVSLVHFFKKHLAALVSSVGTDAIFALRQFDFTTRLIVFSKIVNCS